MTRPLRANRVRRCRNCGYPLLPQRPRLGRPFDGCPTCLGGPVRIPRNEVDVERLVAIFAGLRAGKSHAALAKQFGVCEKRMWKIIRDGRWVEEVYQ